MLKAYFVKSTILLSIILLTFNSLMSEDTITVQTLTFDDITNRRGVWQFPDGSEPFRKILALYTLKCDRKTAQDIYYCGEWDYGANIFVYQHTGIMDSNLVNQPMYNFGGGNPDTLKLCWEKPHTIYQQKREKKVIDEVLSESDHILGNGDFMLFGSENSRMQILYTKEYLQENDMLNKEFLRLKLMNISPGVTLKNLTIRQANSSEDELTEFKEIKSPPLYQGDYEFSEDEWVFINLINPLKTNPFQGFILDISYDEIENASQIQLYGDVSQNVLISQGIGGWKNGYLSFDGVYDRVDCGVVKGIKDSEKLTVEMKLKINKWRKNGNIFRIGNGLEFKTVEEYMQPRRYYVRMQDGNEFGIMVAGIVSVSDEWDHFAIVFDGTKEQFDGRIKFYLNGYEVPGNIRGNFPDKFPDADNILRLNWINGNVNCDIDEFRIWTEALSPNTIQKWINKTISEEHENYSNLEIYYDMNSISSNHIANKVSLDNKGFLVGRPDFKTISAKDQTINQEKLGYRPAIVFVEGEYSSHNEDEIVDEIIAGNELTLLKYVLDGYDIRIEDYITGYQSGTYYTFDPDGNKIDSTIIEPDTVIIQEKIEYYSAPYEIVKRKEIGRSITPYGKGLDLGPEGFTWVYDMTDYAPWLQGDVDLSAHRQNELIDLKFLLIKGTPPRDVLDIQSLWTSTDAYNFLYRDLSNDTQMDDLKVDLLGNTDQMKVRMRMTGHGHYSDNGEFPYCCEWKDNTHYLYVNGNKEYEWHIFKNTECAENPVFPQGGTWLGAREGWCPGDIIKEQDFYLSDYVGARSINLDYEITPVPENNQGMGNGNYWTTVHFFQYGSPNFENDIEVYNVIKPNDNENYRRINPICYAPEIVVRNNGGEQVTSMDIEYYVTGGEKEYYNWEGTLESNELTTVQLPIPNETFWIGDGTNKFNVKVSNPNGKEDEYSVNDLYTTKFEMPDMYNEDLVIRYLTNNRPNNYDLRIRDIFGDIVWEMNMLSAGKLYEEPLELDKGCYTLEMIDPILHRGLSYWFFPEQGSGALSIRNKDGKLLKAFESNFGRSIYYSFSIGDITYVKNEIIDSRIKLSPNPARNIITLTSDVLQGNNQIIIYNDNGEKMFSDNIIFNSNHLDIDISNLIPGVYILHIISSEYETSKKFVVIK